MYKNITPTKTRQKRKHVKNKGGGGENCANIMYKKKTCTKTKHVQKQSTYKTKHTKNMTPTKTKKTYTKRKHVQKRNMYKT